MMLAGPIVSDYLFKYVSSTHFARGFGPLCYAEISISRGRVSCGCAATRDFSH